MQTLAAALASILHASLATLVVASPRNIGDIQYSPAHPNDHAAVHVAVLDATRRGAVSRNSALWESIAVAKARGDIALAEALAIEIAIDPRHSMHLSNALDELGDICLHAGATSDSASRRHRLLSQAALCFRASADATLADPEYLAVKHETLLATAGKISATYMLMGRSAEAVTAWDIILDRRHLFGVDIVAEALWESSRVALDASFFQEASHRLALLGTLMPSSWRDSGQHLFVRNAALHAAANVAPHDPQKPPSLAAELQQLALDPDSLEFPQAVIIYNNAIAVHAHDSALFDDLQVNLIHLIQQYSGHWQHAEPALLASIEGIERSALMRIMHRDRASLGDALWACDIYELKYDTKDAPTGATRRAKIFDQMPR